MGLLIFLLDFHLLLYLQSKKRILRFLPSWLLILVDALPFQLRAICPDVIELTTLITSHRTTSLLVFNVVVGPCELLDQECHLDRKSVV